MRETGILLHPTSLPGPGPAGTLGAEAFDFIDALAEAEVRVWQVLPTGPAGIGGSPYMSPSAFAGTSSMSATIAPSPGRSDGDEIAIRSSWLTTNRGDHWPLSTSATKNGIPVTASA